MTDLAGPVLRLKSCVLCQPGVHTKPKMQCKKQNKTKKSFTSSYGAEMRPNCPRCGRHQLLLICRQYLSSSNGHKKPFCFLTLYPPHAPSHMQCGGVLCHVDGKKHLRWQTWEGIASQAPLPTWIRSSGFDFSNSNGAKKRDGCKVWGLLAETPMGGTCPFWHHRVPRYIYSFNFSFGTYFLNRGASKTMWGTSLISVQFRDWKDTWINVGSHR